MDVTASEASLSAALGLANDLFNALHSVGHRVVNKPVPLPANDPVRSRLFRVMGSRLDSDYRESGNFYNANVFSPSTC